MTTAAPAAPHRRRITLVGVVLLLVLAGVIAWGPRWTARLQAAWFDACQVVVPRQPVSMPVTVVVIDERSLARYGQWPWPRTLLAELIGRIGHDGPLAIGVDILMPEPDRLSPEQILQSARRDDPVLAGRLAALPTNDGVLADAIARQPVVLGYAGLPTATDAKPLAPPFMIVDRGGAGDDAAPGTLAFAGALVNVPQLDRAAAGHGLLSASPEDATIVRRAPLVARVADRFVPSLAAEMLRVALGPPAFRLFARGPGVGALGIADLTLPTEPDGQVRLHFARLDGRRDVSASDVLAGRVDPALFQRKLVLVSVTALALGDWLQTPLGERMPGGEVHAQLLENVFDQSWLTRPRTAAWWEAALFVALGLVLVYATPRWKPARSALLALACVLVMLAAGFAAFAAHRVLLDAAVPSVALLLLFGCLLLLTLGEATRQRRALERAIQAQREEAAYMAGELQAAQRIQAGFLPRAGAFADPRAEIAAAMQPAREVGGDLYDFFARDRDRLFFLVGDVAGKGLSASLFMAMGKALTKSVALRDADATTSDILRAADREIARDNAESFFITAVAGTLDLRTGVLEYCNAGHENPFVLRPDQGDCARLPDGAGPPLCTVDDFAYVSGRYAMAAGEVVCVVTDGVGDAQAPGGARYGVPRLLTLLTGLARPGVSAPAVVEAVRGDVAAFAADAEPADDVTVLALRWNGVSGR
ncbi:MAG: CHASE2 domain-containing protein [Burkholderiales bacterium]